MKRKLILIVSVLLVLGLGAITFAYTTQSSEKPAACCCCKGDSCPMKIKGEAKADAGKMHEEKMKASSDEMKNVVVAASSEGCCCSCCGDKKKS